MENLTLQQLIERGDKLKDLSYRMALVIDCSVADCMQILQTNIGLVKKTLDESVARVYKITGSLHEAEKFRERMNKRAEKMGWDIVEELYLIKK